MTDEKDTAEDAKESSNSKDEKKANNVMPKILGLIIVILVGYLIYTKTQEPKNVDEATASESVDTDQAMKDASDPKKWSYAFGRIMGRDISSALTTFSEGPEVDKNAIVQAVEDALNEVEGDMTDIELQAIIQERIKLEQEAIKARGEEQKEVGLAFVESYKLDEGVIDAGNGSLYRVISEGAGETIGENVATVVYTGKHVNGDVFDSTDKNGGVPAQFVKEGVIPGLGEVLAQMKKGDKWEIVVPSENAYGPNGIPGVILPHETLIFDIEVVEVAPRPEQSVATQGTPTELAPEAGN